MFRRALHYIRLARGRSPGEIFSKGFRVFKSEFFEAQRRTKARFFPTYSPFQPFLNIPLQSCFPAIPSVWLTPHQETILTLAELYVSHRFDLLGSGWLQVKHGMACPGLEGHLYPSGPTVTPDKNGNWLNARINRANRPYAKKIWRAIKGDYQPIDWHLDYKSGYRWRENDWFMNVIYAHKPGVDVKVPWELARMQHLVVLAYAHILSKKEKDRKEVYALEFQNQILDFLATNPPGFGVNWRCTMDVGIRVANWLTAYDILTRSGYEFDAAFQAFFTQGIYDHGKFIISHLEYNPQLRGNHYLADITGLLFVSAYLPVMPETTAWLAFSLQEMNREVLSQFHPDGSNFEASTCYHRLSVEMVLYAVVLSRGFSREKTEALKTYDHNLHPISEPRLDPAPLHSLTLNKDKPCDFSKEVLTRLEKAGEFLSHITRPDNAIPQFGDNDSGRFLKMQPTFQTKPFNQAVSIYGNLKNFHEILSSETYLREDFLDTTSTTNAIAALFGQANSNCLESLISTQPTDPLVSYRETKAPPMAESFEEGPVENLKQAILNSSDFLPGMQREYRFPIPESTAPPMVAGYPGMGVYIFNGENFFLAIRCGEPGQKGNGGHAHNDQLSIELFIDGKVIIQDPGSCLYTPLTERRNQYRSVKAHFAPCPSSGEPGRLDVGIFKLDDHAKAEVLYFGKEGFLGRHTGFGYPLCRALWFEKEALVIRDFWEKPTNIAVKTMNLNDLNESPSLPFSPGYGWWQK